MGEGTQSEKEKSSSVLIRMGWGRELSGREKKKSGCKIIREGWQEGGHHIHTCTGAPNTQPGPGWGRWLLLPDSLLLASLVYLFQLDCLCATSGYLRPFPSPVNGWGGIVFFRSEGAHLGMSSACQTSASCLSFFFPFCSLIDVVPHRDGGGAGERRRNHAPIIGKTSRKAHNNPLAFLLQARGRGRILWIVNLCTVGSFPWIT